MKQKKIDQKKTENKGFAWYLFVRYSGDSSSYHIRNDDKELILLDREPTAEDLGRFSSEYTFVKCSHFENQSLGHVEYCGWQESSIRRGDHKKKHDPLTPCYRAKVNRIDLFDLMSRVMVLEGRPHSVNPGSIPVPIYRTLDDYFEEEG